MKFQQDLFVWKFVAAAHVFVYPPVIMFGYLVQTSATQSVTDER